MWVWSFNFHWGIFFFLQVQIVSCRVLLCFPAVTGRFRQAEGGVSQDIDTVQVFITSSCRRRFAIELEPSSLTLPDFTVAASSLPVPPPSSPPLPSAPCLSLWSCLPWLSTSPVWPSATSLPSLPLPLPRSHSSLLGWGAPGDGPRGLAIQNANQALCGTSHDFPPRHELLFCYWFHYNQMVLVTFLLSGGRSAALNAAEGLPVIWPFSHSFRIYLKPLVKQHKFSC